MYDSNKNLSTTFFSLDEILVNNTRSELIDLIYNPNITANMNDLCRIIDNFRDELQKPIIITSWYRDEAHNQRVGGARNSKHLLGAAVDITSPDFESLYKVVAHSEKKNWRFLPYINRKFLHIELLRYKKYE